MIVRKGEMRMKGWFFLILAGLILSVTLLGAEVLTRILRPYHTPDTVRAASLVYVPSIFARKLLAPRKGLVAKLHSGGQTKFYINEAGYRGSSFPVRKPHGERRIVIVGGSAVFDPFATDENGQEPTHWPSLVERALNNKLFRS